MAAAHPLIVTSEVFRQPTLLAAGFLRRKTEHAQGFSEVGGTGLEPVTQLVELALDWSRRLANRYTRSVYAREARATTGVAGLELPVRQELVAI